MGIYGRFKYGCDEPPAFMLVPIESVCLRLYSDAYPCQVSIRI